MSRPLLLDVPAAINGWDAWVTTNIQILRDGPMPLKQYDYSTALPAAGSYDRCFAFKQLVNAGPWYLAYSDGTAWHYIADDQVPVGDKSTFANVVGKLFHDFTSRANSGGGETDLASYTLPANVLNANGRTLKIRAWGTTANNANAKTLKLYLGATAILTYSLTVSQAGVWVLEATVMRSSSGNQVTEGHLVESPGNKAYAELATPAITDTATIVIKVTGQGVASNDVLQKGMLVEYGG